ncbi:hypothetical protein POSPLADRAFT_1156240 [Postia placenta MAD-698-R-SB12]|uniref:Uncharacterized protein n=1 Tax=Postia placenta MAD-698-R-SB12 TaxID=670580 RepID=A0A1X6MMV3_9APHY|nr:hypothetical protein POSPLADRAFT_1156240 [Postia placenta MAD-698-R-SB12]OSX57680.1 hypothetical protein POSPLADRAFT_1156240 [Postia placenta MAD-698-R-SB12]
MLGPSDRLVPWVILFDRSGCPVGAQLLLAGEDKGVRTIWDVDINKVLRVECVNLALTGSHDGWGEDGEEPKPRVREDKYRPLKCRY